MKRTTLSVLMRMGEHSIDYTANKSVVVHPLGNYSFHNSRLLDRRSAEVQTEKGEVFGLTVCAAGVGEVFGVGVFCGVFIFFTVSKHRVQRHTGRILRTKTIDSIEFMIDTTTA